MQRHTKREWVSVYADLVNAEILCKDSAVMATIVKVLQMLVEDKIREW